MGDFYQRESKAKKIARIANCFYFDTISCKQCKEKFVCHTTRIKCYQLTEYYRGYRVYRVFAESEEKAEEYYDDFLGNEAIIEEYHEGEDSVENIETEVVELTQQRKSGKIKV